MQLPKKESEYLSYHKINSKEYQYCIVSGIVKINQKKNA